MSSRSAALPPRSLRVAGSDNGHGEGLVRALRGVVRGEASLSRDLETLMIDALHSVDSARPRPVGVLSSREREALDIVAQGARNKQIAATLTISEFTVKRHVQNILNTLEVPAGHAGIERYYATVGPTLRHSRRGDGVAAELEIN